MTKPGGGDERILFIEWISQTEAARKGPAGDFEKKYAFAGMRYFIYPGLEDAGFFLHNLLTTLNNHGQGSELYPIADQRNDANLFL